jgi:hypothetical protein
MIKQMYILISGDSIVLTVFNVYGYPEGNKIFFLNFTGL